MKLKELQRVGKEILQEDSYEKLITLTKKYLEIDSSINFEDLSEKEKEEHKYIFEATDEYLTSVQEDYCLSWELDKLLDDKKLKKLYNQNWEVNTGVCLYEEKPNKVLECLLGIIADNDLEKEKGSVLKEFNRIMQNVPTDLPSLTHSNCTLYDWVLRENMYGYFFTTGKPAMSNNYSFFKGATSKIITLY